MEFKKYTTLKKTGYKLQPNNPICWECPNVYLEADNDDYEDGFGNIVHAVDVHCIHEDACMRILDILTKKEEEELE